MPLSAELLDILRCPESKSELIFFREGDGHTDRPFLFCPTSRLRYPIDEQGIPVMLIEEAERLEQAACTELLARAESLGLTAGVDG